MPTKAIKTLGKMKKFLILKAKTSGKFKTETINGREHVVAQMRPIEGDSVMNGLRYPMSEVQKSFGQLENLLAPAGHPEIDGQPTQIKNNPVAINSYNVGAFVRNPTINGKAVLSELVIDEETASQTEKGREILRRIKSGKRMGVSTGLTAKVNEKRGNKGKRNEFFGEVENIEFDHVAVLLSEEPAGQNTFTLNKNRGRTKMDEITLDVSDLAIENRKRLAAMDAETLINELDKKPTLEQAKAVVIANNLHIHSVSEKEVTEFIENKDAFDKFKEKLTNARNERIEFILKNSKSFDRDTLDGLEDALLAKIEEGIVPENDYTLNNGKRVSTSKLELIDCDELEAQFKKEA